MTDTTQPDTPVRHVRSNHFSRRTFLSTTSAAFSLGVIGQIASAVIQESSSTLVIESREDEFGRAAYTASVTGSIRSPPGSRTITTDSTILGILSPGDSVTLTYTGTLERVLVNGDASISADAQSTTPDTVLAVDDQSVIDERPASFDNTLTVTKKEQTFELAPYTVTTTGTIVPTTDTEGVSDGTTAVDAVGVTSETDTYRYTGELESIATLGPAIFTRNGEQISPTEITGPPFRRVFPEMHDPTVAPGTTVHFELADSLFDQTRSIRSEWWVDGTLITDSFFDTDPVERSMFPFNHDYFHYTFDKPGTYTVEGALLPERENTRDTSDTPTENRVTWEVTVRDSGNRAPQVGPRFPADPMTVGEESFALEANVIDWDGELARVYWRYRFGDVYLGDTTIGGVHDVARRSVLDLELYHGAFEVIAVNTTGAVTSAILWEVESSSLESPSHTIRPLCEHTVRGINASREC